MRQSRRNNQQQLIITQLQREGVLTTNQQMPPEQHVPTPEEYAWAHRQYQQMPPAERRAAQERVRAASMDGRPAGQTTPRSRIVALFALAIALPAWLEGARTTRDGWILFLNWILARAHVPVVVAPSDTWPWWVALGVLIVLGYGYSRVEINHAPIRPPRSWRKDFFNWGAWKIDRTWQSWLIWFVLIATDVGTMYLGAHQTRPEDPAFFQQIAASVQAAAVYAIIITFVPDQLLRYGWHSLRGA